MAKDDTQSRSITPTIIRRNLTPESKKIKQNIENLTLPVPIVIKEYQTNFIPQAYTTSNPVVKRFAINPDHTKYLIDQTALNPLKLSQSDLTITKKDLHRIEKEAFKNAFTELNTPDVYTVLVDTFEREDIKDSKKIVTG